ncbi:hypothetical protein MD484_g4750, partial [Candolleomyces efflorescens]
MASQSYNSCTSNTSGNLSLFSGASRFGIGRLDVTSVAGNGNVINVSKPGPVYIQSLHQQAAPGASHDCDERHSRPPCYPDTREDVFQCIAESKKPIVLVHARAGQGKSTIAQTLAERYSEKNQCGASFFFDRTSPRRNNPSYLVATLATQLTSSIPGLEECIERALEAEGLGILEKDQKEQLEKILVEPLLSLQARAVEATDFGEEEVGEAASEFADLNSKKKWIIIDGLDACIAPTRHRQQPTKVDAKFAQLRVLSLIDSLRSRGLPFSFLIFARPETWIMEYCRARSKQKFIELVDLCAFASHKKDVEIVLRVGLCRIAAKERRRLLGLGDTGTADEDEEKEPDDDDVDMDEDLSWPGEDRVQRLITMIDGDMLSASNVVKQIETSTDDPEDRLDVLLEKGLQSESEGSRTSAIAPTNNEGQFRGATINGAVQFGGTSTNNTFHQTFQSGSTPQFMYTFNLSPAAGRQVRLVQDSESNMDQRRLQ